jgi:hypothetical protein
MMKGGGRYCSQGKRERCTKFWSENLRRRIHWNTLSRRENTIKMDLKVTVWEMWTGFIRFRIATGCGLL